MPGRGSDRITDWNGRAHRKFAWEKLSDSELLDLPLRELGVRVEGTWIEQCLDDLIEELSRRGIRFKPYAWLSSDCGVRSRKSNRRDSFFAMATLSFCDQYSSPSAIVNASSRSHVAPASCMW